MSREEIIGQLMEGKYGEIYQCLMNDARAFAPDALLDEVEDCLQEAFLLLYSQWPKYQNIKNLPGWLYVTALNALRNRQRLYRARSKTVTASLDDDNGALQRAAQRLDQWERAQAAEQEWIQDGLQSIRQCVSQQEYAFLLECFRGKNAMKQMAQDQNLSEAGIRKRKQRVIDKIKRQLFNMILTIILSQLGFSVTLLSEGSIMEKKTQVQGEDHPDDEAPNQAAPLSKESAAVVAEFLRSLPADVFDERCLRLLCLCNRITDAQFGKDPVDVEAAIREHKRRVAQYEAQKRREAAKNRRIGPKAAAALIAAACLVLAGAVCYGLGWTPWRIFTWQDDEHYNFTIYTQYDSATDPYTTFQPTGLDEELDRLLQEYEIYLPLPTWIPQGYGKPEFEIDVVDMMISFGAYFPKDDHYLSMVIHKDLPGFEGVEDGYMEKDNDYYEEYTVAGNTFIIVSNVGRLQAKWFEQPYQLLITGRVTPEEMHSILDSIFERG